MNTRLVKVTASAVAAILLTAGLAAADEVRNNVTSGASGKLLSVAEGATLAVAYHVTATGGDGQNGCNANDGSPVTVTPVIVPEGAAPVTGVTWAPASLTFNACRSGSTLNDKTLVFTGVKAGRYNIQLNAVDSGAGSYDTKSFGEFVLDVNVVDATAPVLTPSIVGTLGTNGWYTSDVTVSWSAADGESGVTSSTGCGTTVITADTAGTVLTCTATNGAGLVSTSSVTIARDATAPVIGFVERSPDAAWVNSAVTVEWSCTDALSGVVAARVTEVVSTEGQDQQATGSCVDLAGNTASDTQGGISIDLTAPDLGLATLSSTQFVGATPSFSFSPVDLLSGVVASGCTGPATLAPGANAFTCWADDAAGNSASSTFTIHAVYDHTGFLQPINNDGSSVFKRGSTVPVKFAMRGDSAGISTAVVTLWVAQISNGVAQGEAEAVSTSAATTGNLFRYSVDGDQYIFNLATKNLAEGKYRLTAAFDDGTTMSVTISLRK